MRALIKPLPVDAPDGPFPWAPSRSIQRRPFEVEISSYERGDSFVWYQRRGMDGDEWIGVPIERVIEIRRPASGTEKP